MRTRMACHPRDEGGSIIHIDRLLSSPFDWLMDWLTLCTLIVPPQYAIRNIQFGFRLIPVLWGLINFHYSDVLPCLIIMDPFSWMLQNDMASIIKAGAWTRQGWEMLKSCYLYYATLWKYADLPPLFLLLACSPSRRLVIKWNIKELFSQNGAYNYTLHEF